jgi:membrane fusion protein, multidrug efflux system
MQSQKVIIKNMKTNILYSILLSTLMVACNSSQSDGDLDSKKEALEAARKDMATLKEKIAKLESEISNEDPDFAKQNSNAILVSAFVAQKQRFEHKVTVRGSVESRRNVFMSAQMGGEIQKIYVKEGQRVSQGQLLIAINADVIRNSIAELKTSLELANTVYDKQTKLWEQKIGTEIQYLQAKNNKESLERKLATTYAQLDQALVKAPFAGTVDELAVNEGEMAVPGFPLVRLVSQDNIYIKADVSERFIGKFNKGDKVDIYFPAYDKHVMSSIASVGQVINPENRTFVVEVLLPKVDFVTKPNQVAVLELRDYVSEETLSVPTRIIQKDDGGQFVYVLDDRGGKLLAKKVHVETGVSSTTQTEIISGLHGSERIVDQGFRDLTEGVEVELADSPKASPKVIANN